jgi:MFS family permease
MPGNHRGTIPGASVEVSVAQDPPRGLARPTHVRYIVLGLTIGAYMITYIDRVVISSAVPSIQKEFGFSIVTMGWILSSFQWAYAIGWVIESALGARWRSSLAGGPSLPARRCWPGARDRWR